MVTMHIASLSVIFFFASGYVLFFSFLVVVLSFAYHGWAAYFLARYNLVLVQLDQQEKWQIVSPDGEAIPVRFKHFFIVGQGIFILFYYKGLLLRVAVFSGDQFGNQFHRLKVYFLNSSSSR